MLCTYLVSQRTAGTSLFKVHLFNAPLGVSNTVYFRNKPLVLAKDWKPHPSHAIREPRNESTVSLFIDPTLCLPSTRCASAHQDIVRIDTPLHPHPHVPPPLIIFFSSFSFWKLKSSANGIQGSGTELGEDMQFISFLPV